MGSPYAAESELTKGLSLITMLIKLKQDKTKMSLKLNSQGFAAVEAVLIIVILAILGGTSYYVYHAHQKINQTLNVASQVSQSAPKFSSQQKAAVSHNYLKLSDWNVEGENDFTDKLTASAGLEAHVPYYGFSSQNLTAADSQCSADNGSAGIIERYQAQDHITFTNRDADNSDPTVAEYIKTVSSQDYKQVGNYFYFYRSPQGLCGSVDTTLFSNTAANVKKFLLTLRSY